MNGQYLLYLSSSSTRLTILLIVYSYSYGDKYEASASTLCVVVDVDQGRKTLTSSCSSSRSSSRSSTYSSSHPPNRMRTLSNLKFNFSPPPFLCNLVLHAMVRVLSVCVTSLSSRVRWFWASSTPISTVKVYRFSRLRILSQ